MNIQISSLSGRPLMIVRVNGMGKQETLATLKKAAGEVKKYTQQTLLMITDVTNTPFDKDVSEAFKGYAAHNKPYVLASSIIGISGLNKIILTAVARFTGRSFYIAKDLDDARAWLKSQV